MNRNNTQGRQLIEGKESPHYYGYECAVESLDRHRTLPVPEIVGKSLELSLDDVTWMMERFRIDSQSQFWQNKLKEKQHDLLDPTSRGFSGY